MSMTSRGMADLRKEGHVAGIVEKFVRFPPPGHRVDLFGIIDIVAVRTGEVGVLGVQVTSGANVMKRVAKALLEPRLLVWLLSGNRFEVWGYRKMGKAGKRKLWVRRIERAVLHPDGVTIVFSSGFEGVAEESDDNPQVELPLAAVQGE